MAVATAAPPQAIAGVSPTQEREIETEYPSIAAVAPGRLLGGLLDSIPVGIGSVKLSYLLFGLPLAPLGLFGYLQLKVTGMRYTVTNRNVSIRSALTGAISKQVALRDIARIDIEVLGGQEFFKAGDVILRNSSGDELLRCAGIPDPERFRRVILDARNARIQSDEALEAIKKRG